MKPVEDSNKKQRRRINVEKHELNDVCKKIDFY